MKVYKSKSGLRFAISSTPKDSEFGIVYFSPDEILWIKAQNLSSAAFEFIWKSKKEDVNYSPIPLEKDQHADLYKKAPKNEMAIKYSQEILDRLTGKTKKESE